MQFSLETSAGQNSIRAYREGAIIINDREIRRSVIVTGDALQEWPPQDFASLAAEHFEQIKALQPEIVLLGTGARQQFPHPGLTQALLNAGIGVEVMATDAACRTYNIILAEGRPVAAALLMI